jgi:hypothetical protein
MPAKSSDNAAHRGSLQPHFHNRRGQNLLEQRLQLKLGGQGLGDPKERDVKLGIFDGDSGQIGRSQQDRHDHLTEPAPLCVVQAEGADHAAAYHQRHSQQTAEIFPIAGARRRAPR